jgi:voltage-gated potassium channel
MWLPPFGWRPVNRALRAEVEAALNLPMLIVALAVLPVVLLEFFWAEQLATNPPLSRATELATAVIWLAFCAEFLVMASLAEHKLAYCKQHWLDLAIILLPLIAFLRALRLGRLLRLNALAKTSRMYKLRGVLMRGYRALLVVKAIDRLLNGSPEKRLARLRRRVIEQETLLEELRDEIRRLEAEQAAQAAEAA